MQCSKKKLEELVTKHLGGEKDVSNEDVKSSVLYGERPDRACPHRANFVCWLLALRMLLLPAPLRH